MKHGRRKWQAYGAILLFITATLSAQSLERIPGTITFATFNIRQFSDRSRDDAELGEICSILRMFDFVAIQEVKDEDILIRTVRMLSDQYGGDYEYVVSGRVGRGSHYERYAFLYRKNVIESTGSEGFIPDPVDYFIREPYFAGFRAADFDFYVISFHLLYGDRKSDRRQEAILLDMEGMQFINLEPTTLGENLYDNIWFQRQYTLEFIETGIVRFDEDYFDNDDEAAKLIVSDHRPLWARFDIAGGDDD